ncbi:MAG: hypothetical protein M3N02_01465, partial [Pseudomonadota bacterium]|nr:hypothetical protein [Pseudomonadota bacterium]
ALGMCGLREQPSHRHPSRAIEDRDRPSAQARDQPEQDEADDRTDFPTARMQNDDPRPPEITSVSLNPWLSSTIAIGRVQGMRRAGTNSPRPSCRGAPA